MPVQAALDHETDRRVPLLACPAVRVLFTGMFMHLRCILEDEKSTKGSFSLPLTLTLSPKGNAVKLGNVCHCEERERRSNLQRTQGLLRCARNDTPA